jgi:hypothetical protein
LRILSLRRGEPFGGCYVRACVIFSAVNAASAGRTFNTAAADAAAIDFTNDLDSFVFSPSGAASRLAAAMSAPA